MAGTNCCIRYFFVNQAGVIGECPIGSGISRYHGCSLSSTSDTRKELPVKATPLLEEFILVNDDGVYREASDL